MSVGVIIVGAGKGLRLGQSTPKCLIRVEDIPLILITANSFQINHNIEAIVLVVPENAVDEIRDSAKSLSMDKVCAAVAGGDRRQESAQNGLKAMPEEIEQVLIHDGARALVSDALINRVVLALNSHQIAIPAVRVTDTLHKVEGGFVVEGADRTGLIAAQTPQGFKRSLLSACFDLSVKNSYTVTDEATLVRDMSGVKAAVVEGDSHNAKITYPEDLRFYMAHLIMRAKKLKAGRSEIGH